MKIISHEDEIEYSNDDNHKSGELINASNGSKNGFCMGLSFYTRAQYGDPGVHEDQEAFFVLEGSGFAKVGTHEFSINPGNSFIVTAGSEHSIKKDRSCKYVKVLWCHGAEVV